MDPVVIILDGGQVLDQVLEPRESWLDLVERVMLAAGVAVIAYHVGRALLYYYGYYDCCPAPPRVDQVDDQVVAGELEVK